MAYVPWEYSDQPRQFSVFVKSPEFLRGHIITEVFLELDQIRLTAKSHFKICRGIDSADPDLSASVEAV